MVERKRGPNTELPTSNFELPTSNKDHETTGPRTTGPQDHGTTKAGRWEMGDGRRRPQVTGSVPHESRYNYSGSRGSQNRAQRNGRVLYLDCSGHHGGF